MQWEMVLGLEVHTQLATKSKLFSAAATEYGAKPNPEIAVDLAYPGMLPVLNPEVYNMAVKFGLSIDAKLITKVFLQGKIISMQIFLKDIKLVSLSIQLLV